MSLAAGTLTFTYMGWTYYDFQTFNQTHSDVTN